MRALAFALAALIWALPALAQPVRYIDCTAFSSGAEASFNEPTPIDGLLRYSAASPLRIRTLIRGRYVEAKLILNKRRFLDRSEHILGTALHPEKRRHKNGNGEIN